MVGVGVMRAGIFKPKFLGTVPVTIFSHAHGSYVVYILSVRFFYAYYRTRLYINYKLINRHAGLLRRSVFPGRGGGIFRRRSGAGGGR